MIFVLFVACTKYENGPDFSLLSRKERLTNNWTVEQAIFLGGDSAKGDVACNFQEMYPRYQFNIGEDEQYTMSYHKTEQNMSHESGTWAFANGKEHFSTTCNSGTITDYEILRLTKNNLWVRFAFQGNQWELHMFPKPTE